MINASINDDVSEDSSGFLEQSTLDKFKEDFKATAITSKDIFLPPFIPNLNEEKAAQARQAHLCAQIEEEANSENEI